MSDEQHTPSPFSGYTQLFYTADINGTGVIHSTIVVGDIHHCDMILEQSPTLFVEFLDFQGMKFKVLKDNIFSYKELSNFDWNFILQQINLQQKHKLIEMERLDMEHLAFEKMRNPESSRPDQPAWDD